MQTAIVKKLKGLLTLRHLADEQQVIYLPVAIRKIAEHEPSLMTTSPTLKFYCDWALHVRMDRNATQEFLKEVNPTLTMGRAMDEEHYRRLDGLLTLTTFKEELIRFLLSQGVDASVFDDTNYWTAFMQSYAAIVEDCELVAKPGTSEPGHSGLMVQSVIIHPSFEPNTPCPPMDWFISYTNGNKGHLQFNGQGLLGATIDLSW